MSTGEGQTEIREFGEILSSAIDGHLPLLVGGHAVNLWAHLLIRGHLATELEKRDLLPLTSKDLDLYGDIRLLTELSRRFGGTVVLSTERSMMVGRLEVELAGIMRKIEVLRDVRGITTKELENSWMPVEFDNHLIRVPLPPVLLKAKLANAAHIDQTDRNDVRHVKIMILVVREYLMKIVLGIEAKEIDPPRVGVIALESTLEIVSSYDAGRCHKLHGIDFTEIWPREVLVAAQSPPIANFVKHRLPAIDQP
ncbi:MAG: hypothetical protein EOP88_24100 [Verrucomicrobiaceae bacterium]|nr:MAG: hypothetical protein EOP88_24100 [Verrucomicrobiaceae bacterium]